MARKSGLLDKLFHQRVLKRWAMDTRNVAKTDLETLRRKRDFARTLKSHLEAMIHRSDERLSMPVRSASNFPRPHNADWTWRPYLWRGPLGQPGLASVKTKTSLGTGITIFHDCPLSEITLRQCRNLRETDLAPYGLALDVLNFEGGFMSIVVDLPADALRDLKRAHVIQIDTLIEGERPLDVFARLNVQHGPNTEQVAHELVLENGRARVEFDLAYTNLNEKRVEKAWVDVIFEGAAMNRVELRDLTFSRRLRAAL
ncbi:MAG: DUF6478 family protein [Aliishimia sp.]